MGGGGQWTALTPNSSSSNLKKKSRSRSRTPEITITGTEDQPLDDDDSEVDDIPMLEAGTAKPSYVTSSGVLCAGPAFI